jgi:hypothetical protein
MQTEATLSTIVTQPEATAHVKISRVGPLERCRHFIEATDWDENLLRREKWIDRICLGIAVLSALYFVPALLSIHLK